MAAAPASSWPALCRARLVMAGLVPAIHAAALQFPMSLSIEMFGRLAMPI
jgi:hypothetical protein